MNSLLSKSTLMFFLIVSFANNVAADHDSNQTLTLEIENESKIEEVSFSTDDILKVGINERLGGIRIEIILSEKHHLFLERVTKDNIGNKVSFKINGETFFTGTIYVPILNGIMSLPSPSENEAKAIVKKMGMDLDYHLKLTPEELEAAKLYTRPSKNPWAKKALDAITVYHDLEKAEEFARKAIESDPNEPAYYKILSTIYFRQGKKKLALEEILTAERLSKKEDLEKFPGTYLSIAELYEHFSEYGKAIEYINKVLSSNENNLLAHSNLAEVYEKMGKYDLAVQEYLLLSKSDDEHFRKRGLEGIKRLKEE